MRNAPAFAIYEDVGHCCPLAPEELAHDFLFFVVTKSVQAYDAQGGCVAYHISIDYLTTLLALEFLCIVFAVDAVLVELEIVTLGIGTESHRFRMGKFFFHSHPIVFFQLDLDEDDAFFFVEVKNLFGEFLADEKHDSNEWLAFIIQKGNVRSMPVDGEVGS